MARQAPLYVVIAGFVALAMTLPAPMFADEPGLFVPAPPPGPPPSLYQLHFVQAAPGKLDALHARYRDHQIRLANKHGIESVGFFTPAGENPDGLIFSVVRFHEYEKSLSGWSEFVSDPEWKDVVAETEKDGPLIANMGRKYLRATHYSPLLEIKQANPERVFELRTYTCPTRAKLGYLNKRFREHTMKLFEKHGMENLIYWNRDEDREDDQMLVYMLGHKSIDAAKASFAAFRQDPDWLEAKAKSEELAGGSLTEKENGVVSQFLLPTEYSPLK